MRSNLVRFALCVKPKNNVSKCIMRMICHVKSLVSYFRKVSPAAARELRSVGREAGPIP